LNVVRNGHAGGLQRDKWLAQAQVLQ